MWCVVLTSSEHFSLTHNMQLGALVALAALSSLVPCAHLVSGSSLPWPSSAISWWYSPESNWQMMLEEIRPHLHLVTSVMVYCGPEITDEGTIYPYMSPLCYSDGLGVLPALSALGVRPEIWLGFGNCSIDGYRLLWADHEYSVQTLVSLAVQYNISGWNIDIEPASDNCRGGPTGTPEDSIAYAGWLLALRAALHKVGVRLTVDVDNWSPVTSQFAALAPSVDRLFDMRTYNADSMDQWMEDYYEPYINGTGLRNATGVGLGCYVVESTNGTWSVTPASATERIDQIIEDNIPEIAMFNLWPATGLFVCHLADLAVVLDTERRRQSASLA